MSAEKIPSRSKEVFKPDAADTERDYLERQRHLEKLSQAAEETGEHQDEAIAEARTAIEQQPRGEIQVGQTEALKPTLKVPTAKEKSVAYRQTLRKVRNSLPTSKERVFSALIHQPAVERFSDVAAKTIFRPSLTLGISLGALIGGGGIYLLARRTGFAISGSEFLLFGLGGGALGLLLELIKNLFNRSALSRQ